MSWLMIALAISGSACGLAARRTVPWQGRQATLVMAIAMIAVALAPDDPRLALLCGAALVVSAMLGTAGLRGADAAGACCHRAVGSLAMAVCTLGAVAPASAVTANAAAGSHGGHLGTDPIGALAAFGVVTLVAWTMVAQVRSRCRARADRVVLAAEPWIMTFGVVVMWAMH